MPTTEEWKAKAINIWGDEYDYSRVEYVNNKTKVLIICRVEGHPPFLCSPSNHCHKTHPGGCPLCRRERQKATQTKSFSQFEKEAWEMHGYKNYKYDEDSYINALTPMRIFCKVHGEFPKGQRPDSHLRGSGCPRCARKIRSRKELAIWETIVGQRIADLSEDCVELISGSYKGQNKFANFRCELHDDFPRLVTVALYSKHPCPDCARSAGVSIPHDTESFLELAKTKFGD